MLFGTYTYCAPRVLSPRYERRFVELYDQVEEKLYETRKYFVTYKMLERTKVFLEKEVCRQGSITRVQRNTSNSTLQLIPVALLCVWGWAQESLIHSINDNFVKSMKSKSGRQAFLKQCITIVQGLQVTLADADLPAQCRAARAHIHTHRSRTCRRGWVHRAQNTLAQQTRSLGAKLEQRDGRQREYQALVRRRC